MKRIDQLISWIGKQASLLNVVLILLICLDVLLRYMFNATQKWVIELEWHLFAVIFLLGASYTMQADKHVRVDLFYQNYSEKMKQWVNIIGNVVFLIPWCLVLIYVSYKYANVSYSYLEGSPDPGGLPARYVIKYMITFGFGLLLLQCISDTINKLKKVIAK